MSVDKPEDRLRGWLLALQDADPGMPIVEAMALVAAADTLYARWEAIVKAPAAAWAFPDSAKIDALVSNPRVTELVRRRLPILLTVTIRKETGCSGEDAVRMATTLLNVLT